MEKELFKLYLKGFLRSKNVECSNLSYEELLAISVHLGEPDVNFRAWCDVMNVDVGEPEVEETVEEKTEEEYIEEAKKEIDDEINSALNESFVAQANMAGDLQESGVLKIEKVD